LKFSVSHHIQHNWLQPADKAVFKKFKTEWVKEGLKFNNDTAGRKPSKVEFLQLFTKVWEKAATVEVVQGGFRGTGMFPWNPNAVHGVAYFILYADTMQNSMLYEKSAKQLVSVLCVFHEAASQPF